MTGEGVYKVGVIHMVDQEKVGRKIRFGWM